MLFTQFFYVGAGVIGIINVLEILFQYPHLPKFLNRAPFFPPSLLIPLSMLSLCIPCLDFFVIKDFNKTSVGAI